MSFTSCTLSGRLGVPDFVPEVKAVWLPEIWKFIWVSYIIALFDWRLGMMLAEKITTTKIYQK